MLSIEECRNLIGGSEKYSDDEIRAIRDNLRGLAVLALDAWKRNPRKNEGSIGGKS